MCVGVGVAAVKEDVTDDMDVEKVAEEASVISSSLEEADDVDKDGAIIKAFLGKDAIGGGGGGNSQYLALLTGSVFVSLFVLLLVMILWCMVSLVV